MRKNGFTIIELLIASSILAIMLTTMTIALQQQQKQFNLTKEIVDIDQTGRAILDLISSDLRNSAARQGKDISIQFVNGGSDISGGVNNLTGCANVDPTGVSGTINSRADCITVTTWDISRGMTADATTSTTDLPSIVARPPTNTGGGGLTLNLPDQWFDQSGNFIGGLGANNSITLGFRSRNSLCSQDTNVNCTQNPELCSECSAIIRGTVTNGQFIAADINSVLSDNFPVTFSGMSEFINGKTGPRGENYGYTPSFAALAAEMSIVNLKTYRIDLTNRELELLQNGGNAQPIAGGQGNTPGGLESPGIVDLQFVFNLQNADGTITKVGACDTNTNGEITNCPCNSTDTDLNQQNFSCDTVENRFADVRSVEIYLVLKSKIQSEIKKSSFSKEQQSIPQIADVLERTVEQNENSNVINEPEAGYVYRVYSTTVYLRNISREDFV